MNCPVCKTTSLLPHEPAVGLRALRCNRCGGLWMRFSDYWNWREAPNIPSTDALAPAPNPWDAPQPAIVQSPPPPPADVHDVSRAKLCPECQRILARYAVGKSLNFNIDRCSACGGIWFDGNEWQTLHAAGLDHDLHLIFSEKWQTEILHAHRISARRKLLSDKLGDDDLKEIERIKSWLDAHPHKAELHAFLIQG